MSISVSGEETVGIGFLAWVVLGAVFAFVSNRKERDAGCGGDYGNIGTTPSRTAAPVQKPNFASPRVRRTDAPDRVLQ